MLLVNKFMVLMTQQYQVVVAVDISARYLGITPWATLALANDVCNLADQHFSIIGGCVPDEREATVRKGAGGSRLTPKDLPCPRVNSHSQLTRNTFITSSPRWLMTFTAMRPDFGLAKAREMSLFSVAQASASISALSVVLRALYGSFAPRK